MKQLIKIMISISSKQNSGQTCLRLVVSVHFISSDLKKYSVCCNALNLDALHLRVPLCIS